MKKILGSLMLVACQMAFAQSTRNVGDFSSLKVYNKINVTLIGSNESKVETEENEMNILDALILVGAAKSKREAREFVNGGSVLINGERIKDLEFTVKKEDAFGQSKTVIRRGKKNYFVLKYNG